MASVLVGVAPVLARRLSPGGGVVSSLLDSARPGWEGRASPHQLAPLPFLGCWIEPQAPTLFGSLGESAWARRQRSFLSTQSLSVSFLSCADLGAPSQPFSL